MCMLRTSNWQRQRLPKPQQITQTYTNRQSVCIRLQASRQRAATLQMTRGAAIIEHLSVRRIVQKSLHRLACQIRSLPNPTVTATKSKWARLADGGVQFPPGTTQCGLDQPMQIGRAHRIALGATGHTHTHTFWHARPIMVSSGMGGPVTIVRTGNVARRVKLDLPICRDRNGPGEMR